MTREEVFERLNKVFREVLMIRKLLWEKRQHQMILRIGILLNILIWLSQLKKNFPLRYQWAG